MANEIPYLLKHDVYAYYGRKLVEHHLTEHLEIFIPPEDRSSTGGLLTTVDRGQVPSGLVHLPQDIGEKKVGIVGAGMFSFFFLLLYVNLLLIN